MVAALCAVFLTAALLLFDWNASPASEEFVKDVRFLIWAALLCAQSAVWVAFALPLMARQLCERPLGALDEASRHGSA